jgi:hypothetical protein
MPLGFLKIYSQKKKLVEYQHLSLLVCTLENINFFSNKHDINTFSTFNTFPLSSVRLLEGWQSGSDGSDIGRYAWHTKHCH